MLTNYNSTNITYDQICNPLKWRNASTIEWRGRRLELLGSTSGKVFDYTYNSDGIRTQKRIYNAGGVLESTVNYILDGSKIIAEYSGNNYTYYVYDESGTVMGMMYNNQLYTFRKNLQGDVTGIYTANGELIAKYRYSPYGEILAITNGNGVDVSSNTSHIANINPFRYLGYYYDTETGFYYVSSRYYDPEIGRWINADGYASTGQGVLGNNMFAYCGNNPVNRVDHTGQFWSKIWEFAKTVVAEFGKAMGVMSPAYAGCGGAALGDGPLPFGDSGMEGIKYGRYYRNYGYARLAYAPWNSKRRNISSKKYRNNYSVYTTANTKTQ